MRKEFRLRYAHRVVSLALFMAVSASLFAAEVTGTVTNGTTGKPAPGVEVVLLTHAGGGMDQAGKATTDAQGHYSMNVPDPEAQHLARVSYQGVNYSESVPPGARTADITIFDSAKQVPGIFEDARVYRVQAANGQLNVEVTYTLRNESTPPRTKTGDETYEVELPPGAELLQASAAPAGGMPLPASPVPTGKKNRYALVFPIRPGQSKVGVIYKLPYKGAYQFNLTPDSQLSELGVLLPKSMEFKGLTHEFAKDSDEAGLAVFFAKNVPAHQQVSFSVSGEGVAPGDTQGADEGSSQSLPQGSAPPEDAGKPGHAIWYAIAGMIVIVAVGAFWLWRRAVSASAGSVRTKAPAKSSARRGPGETEKSGAPSNNGVLDALKDELFQLEKDRLDGKVSPEDHARLKAGLDALIRRHLKKAAG